MMVICSSGTDLVGFSYSQDGPLIFGSIAGAELHTELVLTGSRPHDLTVGSTCTIMSIYYVCECTSIWNHCRPTLETEWQCNASIHSSQFTPARGHGVDYNNATRQLSPSLISRHSGLYQVGSIKTSPRSRGTRMTYLVVALACAQHTVFHAGTASI